MWLSIENCPDVQVWPASDVHGCQPAGLAPAPRCNVGNADLLAELVQAQDGPALDWES